MLNDEEEILLEQYITNKNMSKDKRDFLFNLILNTKEIKESTFNPFINDQNEYKIVNMNFKRQENRVLFNGSASNGPEVRLLDGFIYINDNNKYVVVNNIYRINEYLNDEDRFLNCVDIFEFKDDMIIRKTNYNDTSIFFSDELPLFDENELYDYYHDMVHSNEKKLDL